MNTECGNNIALRAGKAIVRFLLRPFTVMWPMMASMVFLYIATKPFSLSTITPSAALAELYYVALVLSLFRGKWRRWATTLVMAVMGLLTIIELFLTANFRLEMSASMLQMMFETTDSETAQFLETFVYKWKNLAYVALLAAWVAVSVKLHRVQSRGTGEGRFAAWRNKHHGSLQVAAIVTVMACAPFLYGWAHQLVNLARELNTSSVNEFEKVYMQCEDNGGSGAKTPVTRLILGNKLYQLSTHQCDEIIATSRGVKIDSCSHASPNIMLYIGESYIKRHAQVYGYPLPTTPRLQQEMDNGNLTLIADASTIEPQTSTVFKNMLSMHSVDQPDTWMSQPLFPQLLKLAGYRVAFISSQFTLEGHNIWNSTGGFFLRDPNVSKLLLDYQSPKRCLYDDELLAEVSPNMTSTYNMLMFHVKGQHVSFDKGYPPERTHFTVKDYAARRELNDEQRQDVAHYDNCTLFQDSICGALFDRFAQQDMVIVFVSDHGENAYDDGKTMGRVHSNLTPAQVKSEYEIPMWIWCSPRYRELHPDMVQKIRAAASRPFQIDDMPHLILDLAGLSCKYYDPSRDLLSPTFNTPRPRIITTLLNSK